MKKLLLLFLFLSPLFAKDSYELRLAYFRADNNDLLYIMTGNMAPNLTGIRMVSVDGGYKIKENFYNLPIDLYVEGGICKYLEKEFGPDVYENTLYIKGYYNFKPAGNEIRFGLAEGASYTYGTLEVEEEESHKKGGNLSHYLNYLEFSADIDSGKLTKVKALNQLYLGFMIHHRSGIFGLINNVRHGGSNYEGIYLEKKF
jgi:hypothetical protein